MSLRDKLADGPVYGVWSTIADPVVMSLVAVPGIDYVVIDLQHGAADERDLPAMTAVARDHGLAPLVRVRAPQATYVSRALDLGAHGVVVPHVDTAAIASHVADACRYAPTGHRSFGRLVGGVDDPLCVVMVESATAVANADEIAAVDGVDAIYVGPWDLSLSLGCAPDPADPTLAAALRTVWAAVARVGKPVGTHAGDGVTARGYVAAGCRLVTVGTDSGLIRRSAGVELAATLDSDG